MSRVLMRRMLTVAAGGVLVLGLWPMPAEAQGIFGPGRWSGSIEGGYDANESTTSDQAQTVAVGLRRADQRLGIRGWLPIVDRRLAVLNLNVTAGHSGDRILVGSEGSTSGGRLVGYDLSTSLLPNTWVTTSLFASKNDAIVTREFNGSSAVRSARRGLTMTIARLKVPTTIAYRHERMDDDSRFTGAATRRLELRRSFSIDGQRNWQRQSVGLRYERIHSEARAGTIPSYATRAASLQHHVAIGRERGSGLSSSVRFFSREGMLASRSTVAEENLTLQHSRSLASSYLYSVGQYSLDQQSSLTQMAQGSLHHRLYQSLDTDATVRATFGTLPGGRERRVAAQVNPSYRKTLKGGGVLVAGLGGRRERQETLAPSQTRFTVGESHVVRFGVPVRLEVPRVTIDSVTVADAGRTTVFLREVDYELRAFGDFLELALLPAGRIRDGQALAIDYRSTSDGAITFRTSSMHADLSLDYGWARPYVRYESSAHDVIEGAGVPLTDDLSARAVGLRLGYEHRSLRVSMVNEYRTQQSTLLAYDALQLGQAVLYAAPGGITTSFSLDTSWLRYRLPARETRSLIGRGSLGWRSMDASMLVEGTAAMRFWADTLAEDDTLSDASVRLTWLLGHMEIQSGAGIDLRRHDGQRMRLVRTSVRVVRRIGGL